MMDNQMKRGKGVEKAQHSFRFILIQMLQIRLNTHQSNISFALFLPREWSIVSIIYTVAARLLYIGCIIPHDVFTYYCDRNQSFHPMLVALYRVWLHACVFNTISITLLDTPFFIHLHIQQIKRGHVSLLRIQCWVYSLYSRFW